MAFFSRGAALVVGLAILGAQIVIAGDPLEFQLASIDAGHRVPDGDPSIARFRSLLKQLDETYVETPQQIGDMTVRMTQLLREEAGIEETIRNLMEGMNQIFDTKIENQKYAEYISSYYTLRNKGWTHERAVNGLREIIKSLGE